MAGIHPNPGPSSEDEPRFPCGACRQGVRSNCRSVQCSACKAWFHLQCSSLSLSAFRSLPRRHFWSCSACLSPIEQQSSRFQPRVVLSRMPAAQFSSLVSSCSHLQPRVLIDRLPPSSVPSPASRASSPTSPPLFPHRGADISSSRPRVRFAPGPSSTPTPPSVPSPPSRPRSPSPPLVLPVSPLPPAPVLSSSYPPSASTLPPVPTPAPSSAPLQPSPFRCPSLSELKVLQWNANGVRARSDELTDFLSRESFHVVCIQETKLQPSTRFRIPGYKAYRQDRTSTPRSASLVGGRGGGVLTLVRDGLPHSPWPLPDLSSSAPTCDFLGIQVHLRKTTLYLLNAYVPVFSSSADSRRRTLDLSLLPSSPSTFIFGDFNAHHPSWDSRSHPNPHGSEIYSWLLSSDLEILNDPLSHTLVSTAHGSRTSPDLSLAPSALAPRCSWSVLPDLGSDHLPLSITIRLSHHFAPNQRKPAFNFQKADWDVFSSTLTSLCPDPVSYSSLSLSKAVKLFTSIVLQAAKSSVPFGRTHQPPKAWWSPELSELVQKRRAALSKAHISEEHRQAYRSAHREVSAAVAKAKAEAWQRKASSLRPTAQPRKVFSLLRSVAGVPNSSSSSDPTFPGCSSDKALAARYASFLRSHLSCSPLKVRRHEERSFLRELRSSCCNSPDHSSFCSSFSLSELTSAVSHLSSSTAAGPDRVTYPLLSHLPHAALCFLLHIFNLSWSTHSFPSDWKSSTIYPVHKSGKPTNAPSSFRPISLTSCVSKLFERLVLARLSFLLESRNLLTPSQAGFRPARSTTDQIAFLTQSISDGFHDSKPACRTVLATVDFARAFDSVWHPALYHKLLASGLPPCLVRWTQSFLSDRRARVSLRGAMSASFRIRRGVPQGSVLGPVLFNLFINDLSSSLPPDVRFSLYADDLALWASSPSPSTATASVQAALRRLEAWSLKWQLHLNPAKCEVSFFSTSTREASFRPALSLLGNPLSFNPCPVFLGVTLDRTLSFSSHSSALRASCYPRLKALRAVSSAFWGPSKESLASIYRTFLLPALTYASPGWFPYTYAKHLQPLEALHHSACRAITGCHLSTPLPLLLIEAGVRPLSVTLTSQSLSYFERALRLPSSFPLSELAQRPVRKRVRSSSWRFLCSSHPLTPDLGSPRERLVLCPPFPPWDVPSFNVSLSLPIPCYRSDPPFVRSELARSYLSSLPSSDLTIWTDGSVLGKFGPGGSGFFVECTSCCDSFSFEYSAGAVCSSFVSEVGAVHHALSWTVSHLSSCSFTSVRLLSDSQSTLSTLDSSPSFLMPSSLHSIWSSLSTLSSADISVSLQWVPGHSDLPGNDKADALAKRGASLPCSAPQCLSPLTSSFRHSLFSSWRASARSSLLSTQVPKVASEELSLPRSVRCHLSRLRCNGHSTLLESYQERIGRSTSSLCPLCGSGRHDVFHLFSCPSLSSTRGAIFGPSASVLDLWARPWGVARLLDLRGVPPMPRPHPPEGVG